MADEAMVYTREEWLGMIAETDGMECPVDWFDENLEALVTEGKVKRSGRRGPDNSWVRLEIPDGG